MTTIKSILEELAKHSVLAYLHAESATRPKTVTDAQISQDGAIAHALQQIEQLIEGAKPEKYEGYADQIESYKSAVEQFEANLKKVIR